MEEFGYNYAGQGRKEMSAEEGPWLSERDIYCSVYENRTGTLAENVRQHEQWWSSTTYVASND